MAIHKHINVLAGLAVLIVSLTAPARADMDISPLRQVITAQSKTAQFIVSNPSDRIIEGRVTWTDLKATETGYTPAPPELRNVLSAAPYLKVSPAQFRLKPGERMAIDVQLRDNRDLPKGERRSHLLIETDASRTPIRKASNKGLQVDVGLSVSVPVIVRNGGKAKARITGTKLLRDSDGMLYLETSIEPQGSLSTFGDIVVEYESHGSDNSTEEIARRRNIAGFTDASRKTVSLPFGFVSLDPGELTVRYQGAEEYSGVLFDKRAYDIAPAPAPEAE